LVGSAAIIGGENVTPVFANVTPIPTPLPIPQETPISAIDFGEQRPTLPADFDLDHTKMIYFSRSANGRYDLFLYNLLTGERIQLTQDVGDNTYPAVSPDGQTIAYQSNRNGDWDIYLLDVASQESVLLLDTPMNEHMPTWSPDGHYIVFASDTRGDGTYDLFRVPSDGSGLPELVFSDGNRNNHARYSPDGRFLTFVNGSAGDARTWRILTFDLSNGEILPITQNNVRDAYPSFTPDGEHLLYVTEGENNGTRIVRIRADGSGQPRTLYESDGFVWGMHYSPDAQFIAFHEEIDANTVIMLMRADGTDAEQLTGVSGYTPVWLP
jgi:Tol biopolymer transport system component